MAQAPVNSGEDVTVPLGTVSTTRLVRFWDPTPDPVTLLPNDDLGKITVSGTLSGNGEVRILLRPPSDGGWPGVLNQITTSALRNFGIDSSDGIEVSDASLRLKTRLAGFVSGDVRGSIVVGQVQRLQVGGLDPNQATGIIFANITAVAPVFQEGETGTRDSIAYISAGNGIRGTIKAEPATTNGTIGSIIVGPSTQAEGIKGDILAETGLIRAIYTTGPINSGTATAVRIVAGDGIGEIRTINASTGDLVDADVNATIVSNQEMIDDPSTFGYLSPATTGPSQGWMLAVTFVVVSVSET